MMELISAGLAPATLLLACAVAVFAGIVKGATGFALPMIMISGLGSFLTADLALACLILPTLVTNLVQALRQGLGAALAVLRDYWRMVLTIVVVIGLTAQVVAVLPQAVLFALLGGPIVIYGALQLAGRELRINMLHRARWEVGLGAVAGFFGGLAGIWGPPLLVFLLSANTEKTESVRVQGVIYLIGSGALLVAHLQSGILNATTIPLSAALVLPALAGLWLGFVLQDRLDQRAFRRWTLVVLVVAGLNLLRRALTV